MKNLSYLCCLAIAAGTLLLAGCASHPSQPAAPAKVAGPVPVVAPPAKVEDSDITLPPGSAQPPAPFEGQGWEAMCDGKTLDGWRETAFAGRGGVHCQNGLIVLGMGDPFTGLNYTNTFPTMNYEIALDAMRLMGSDFFCGLTVPVGTNCCSLIAGGWGGSLFGISSLDGMDASENETTKFMGFETGRWYRIRLRVTEKKLQAWVNNDKLVDVNVDDHRIAVRPGDIEMSQPIGLAAWQTSAAYRAIKFRRVSAPAGKGE